MDPGRSGSPDHLQTPGPAALKRMIVQRDMEGRRLDYHAPLEKVVWLSGREADHMRSEDAVLGLSSGSGMAWALPWWVLKNHHVANLILDGLPAMVVL